MHYSIAFQVGRRIVCWFFSLKDFQNGEGVDLCSLALVFLPPLLSLWDLTGIWSLSELVDVKKTGIQTNAKEMLPDVWSVIFG